MRYEIEGQILTDIADSIREKTGKSALIKAEDMAREIDGIKETNNVAFYSNDGTLAVEIDQINKRLIWYFNGFKKGANDAAIPAEIFIGQSGLLYSIAFDSDKTTQIGQIGFYNGKIRSWTISTTQTLAGTFWGVVYSDGGTGQTHPYTNPPA